MSDEISGESLLAFSRRHAFIFMFAFEAARRKRGRRSRAVRHERYLSTAFQRIRIAGQELELEGENIFDKPDVGINFEIVSTSYLLIPVVYSTN